MAIFYFIIYIKGQVSSPNTWDDDGGGGGGVDDGFISSASYDILLTLKVWNTSQQ